MAVELLGEFELDRSKLIGKGAWGEVYYGRQVSLDRPVAIKILKKELTLDEEFVKRFQRESACLAKMSDEHIIHVYSAGEYKDSYYFIMELIQGHPLSSFIEEKHKFSVKEIAYVAESVAKALKTAWESTAHIVHRDIKPSNIMVSFSSSIISPPNQKGTSESASTKNINIMDAKIKVMDFGLAKLSSTSEQDATMAGTVIGTPKYISPEQGMGNPVDIRSDIYSLGIVLYEMATGHIPFEGAKTAVSMIRHHIYDTIVPPSKYNADIPADLESIILKCIHNDPEQRYKTPNQLLEDLDAFGSKENLIHATASAPDKQSLDATLTSAEIAASSTTQPKKSRWLLYSLIAGGVVVVAGLIVLIVALAGKQSNNQDKHFVSKADFEKYKKHIAESKKLYALWEQGLRSIENVLPEIDNALKYKPDDPVALDLKSKLATEYGSRGIEYYDRKDFTQAIAEYNKAINLSPKDEILYYNRALAYQYRGDYQWALADYDKSIETNPLYINAYSQRASLYKYKGEYEKAKKDYMKIIEIDSKNAVAYNDLGLVYFDQKNYKKALENYNKALKLEPKLMPSYYNCALIYYEQGQFPRAVAYFTKAIELGSYDSDTYYRRGLAYEQYDSNKSRMDFEKALELDPTYEEARKKLGR